MTELGSNIAVLIVDDDEVTRLLLKEVLEKDGYRVSLASDGGHALEQLRAQSFAIVVSDIRMQGVGGLELLESLKAKHPHVVVVLMTGFGSMELAIQSIQEGAFDYLSKPFQIHAFRELMQRAARQALENQGGDSVGRLRTLAPPVFSEKTLIGKSPRMVEVFKTIARAALTTSPVLLQGERGTGKQRVARAIHDHSARSSLPFEICSSEATLEERLKKAIGGTLLIEDIEHFSDSAQHRILRLMEDAEIQSRDVRWMAMVRAPLAELLEAKTLREDLFYRMDVIRVELPPLRERAEDIPALVDYFLAKFSTRRGAPPVSHFSDAALELLKAYFWPGNLRELEHTIERAVALATSQIIHPEDLMIGNVTQRPVARSQTPALPSARASLDEMERLHILRVLEQSNYNKSRAAKVLGIDRATLYRKAERYGIDLQAEAQ